MQAAGESQMDVMVGGEAGVCVWSGEQQAGGCMRGGAGRAGESQMDVMVGGVRCMVEEGGQVICGACGLNTLSAPLMPSHAALLPLPWVWV